MPSDILGIYTDGGARGNPGPAACAFVVYDSDQKIIYSGSSYIGLATNNVAEYHGVLLALEWIISNTGSFRHITSANFYLDSLLVVNQLKGNYKVKNIELKKLYESFVRKSEAISPITLKFTHVPRSANSVADELLNQTLDMHP